MDWTESTFPGLLGNVVAGRIANRFDLGGTNCVVDAACASSLGAVQMAHAGVVVAARADMVITGGVDAINDIFMFMCFSKTLAMSQIGRLPSVRGQMPMAPCWAKASACSRCAGWKTRNAMATGFTPCCAG